MHETWTPKDRHELYCRAWHVGHCAHTSLGCSVNIYNLYERILLLLFFNWIWAPRGAVMMVCSLPLKTRMRLVRDVILLCDVIPNAGHAPDVTGTDWVLGTQWQHSQSCSCDLQTSIFTPTAGEMASIDMLPSLSTGSLTLTHLGSKAKREWYPSVVHSPKNGCRSYFQLYH